MDFKETLVLQPRMNSLSSANLWRLSWGTIKACSLVSINIPRYWSLVAGDEIHFSSPRKYPSPVNTLYTTYRAASAAFSLNFESRYSKLGDQKPCLLMISPISMPSIYKPQVIPILSKKWVEAIPVVWYINGEFLQSKGIVVPTNHHPFHSRHWIVLRWCNKKDVIVSTLVVDFWKKRTRIRIFRHRDEGIQRKRGVRHLQVYETGVDA